MTTGGDRPPNGREPEPLAPLHALLELARLVQREPAPSLDETLRAVARTVAQATGFDTVVVNQYRPDSDEYAVVAVHGNERAQQELRDQVTGADTWTSVLDERFRRAGVFFIPEGTFRFDKSIIWHVPDIADPDALTDEHWHADDMLFATLDGFRGRHYGIIAVDDPASGRRPDGALLQVLATVAAHATLAIESVLQITELQDALTRNRAVITSALDAILAVDEADRLIDFNPAAERLFGYRAQEVLGQPTTDLLVPEEVRPAYLRTARRIRENPGARALDRRIETTARRRDGSTFPAELTITRVEGTTAGPTFYAFVRDISERRRNEEQMTFLAYHDPLTGLPNRTLVEQELELALARARRAGTAVALMFVDLDDFKTVNDTLGHAIGDRFLTAVAARLKSVLRESDVLARQGGDEFLVLLADLTEEPSVAAGRVAGKLLDALEEPFVVAGHELRTSASVGISVHPGDAGGCDELMRHADAAMYLAKGAGGRRLAFHQPATGDRIDQRSVATGLRAALQGSELELNYQPVRRLDRGRAIVGLEACLRWNHPEHGRLDAPQFMRLADQSEVGIEVVRWTIGEIVRQARAWRQEGLDPLIGLNVSQAQLLAPAFAPGLIGALQDGGLRPGRLIVELTESAWTVDSAEALAVLRHLREAGIALLLDDFGAGYSSLSRLGNLAFDVIKIDPRLLDGIPGDPAAVALLDAVIGLTRACQASLVADGVDSEAQAAFLLGRGIRYGQGEALGGAQTAGALTPLLRSELVSEPAPRRLAAG
jgi:diguanylate cyclase (GGDEF)-like protein/PAS domain S-box-containing protein